MEPRSLKWIAEASGGQLVQGAADRVAVGVSTDTRTLHVGEMFVALRGEKINGHLHIADAAKRGALGLMVERGALKEYPASVAVVEVADSYRALGRLGTVYRQEFRAPAVAVAGSNGKTTTKEILASILSAERQVLWSEASYNNHVGVPLTLLRWKKAHEVAVLEVGTNHPGELAPLLDLIQPRYGIMTSLGREHLEHFGDLEGVIAEEGTLAERLPVDGRLVVSSDAPGMEQVIRRAQCRVIRVGEMQGSDWRVEVGTVQMSGVRFQLHGKDHHWGGEWEIPLLGRHMAINAALALVMARAIGISVDAAKRGLALCQPAPQRMNLFRVAGGILLDDTYNANADSMKAALQTISDLPCAGRRMAVLGDMAELGRHTETAHEEVGEFAAKCGIQELWAIGRFADKTVSAARRAGLTNVSIAESPESVVELVRSKWNEGDCLLVKASRSARLERVVRGLRDSLAGGSPNQSAISSNSLEESV